MKPPGEQITDHIPQRKLLGTMLGIIGHFPQLVTDGRGSLGIQELDIFLVANLHIVKAKYSALIRVEQHSGVFLLQSVFYITHLIGVQFTHCIAIITKGNGLNTQLAVGTIASSL